MNRLQDIYKEIEKHLLEDEKPSQYLDELIESSLSNEYPLTILKDLKKIEQAPAHHPEGNVWKHTLLVVDHAAMRKSKSSDPVAFMWAALLHDLGKIHATKIKNGKITAYNHDKFGKKLVIEFLEPFNLDEDFVIKVSLLVRWHMQILYVVKDLPFANIEKMLAQIDLDDIALLSLCDRLGRGNMSQSKIAKEKKNVEVFLKKCQSNSQHSNHIKRS